MPSDREYPVLEFAKTMAPEGLAHYNPGLGYGFYEFTKPEFILYDKQVIMMDKVSKFNSMQLNVKLIIYYSSRIMNSTMVLMHVV